LQLFSSSHSETQLTNIKVSPKDRKCITIREKIQLLNAIKSYGQNVPQWHIAKQLEISRTTLSNLLKNEEQLRKKFENNPNNPRKRYRHGKNPLVEEAMKRWYTVVEDRGVPMNGHILGEKAQHFAKELGCDDFKVTDGWLSRWKTRNNIKLNKSKEERENEDFMKAYKWKTMKLSLLLDSFSLENIYSAVETGLFYGVMPDGSLFYDKRELKEKKKCLDLITVLCCVNMSATDKRKLLVVGKDAEPSCFAATGEATMPFDYMHSSDACMTSNIFTEWLRKWDQELRVQNQKIVLLVNNCSAHSSPLDLTNIQLEYLPTIKSFRMNPLNTGVVSSLKMLYRSRLVEFALGVLGSPEISLMPRAYEMGVQISLSRAIQFLAASWCEVEREIVANGFANCCYINSNDPQNTILHNIEISDTLKRVTNYQQYLGIDCDLECYNETDADLVEEIVRSIKNENSLPGNENNSQQLQMVEVEPNIDAVNSNKEHFYASVLPK